MVAAPPARAQEHSAHDSGFTMVDRIIAIVGKTPITLSRLEEEWNLLKAGGNVPKDSAGIQQAKRQLLDQIIKEELMVQQAQRDTNVKVTDQQVQSQADAAFQSQRAKFSSEDAFRRELQIAGLGSPEAYRQFLVDRVRRRLLQDGLEQYLRQKGQLRPIPPTDNELKHYFAQAKGQLPRRPATVTFRQVVIRAKPDSSAVLSAKAKADSLLNQLRHGADFAQLAKRYSDDAGTATQGGELGWFRRGQMLKAFENVAFRLKPGQISDVVRTPYGFHIIQTEHVEPGEVQARHILISPEITEADILRAKFLADSVAAEIRNGVSVDSLAAIYNEPELDQTIFEEAARTDLPSKQIQQALADTTLKPGTVVGPVQESSGPGTAYAVIKFLGAKSAGAYTFDELKELFQDQLAQQNAIDHYIATLRAATYVDVRW